MAVGNEVFEWGLNDKLYNGNVNSGWVVQVLYIFHNEVLPVLRPSLPCATKYCGIWSKFPLWLGTAELCRIYSFPGDGRRSLEYTKQNETTTPNRNVNESPAMMLELFPTGSLLSLSDGCHTLPLSNDGRYVCSEWAGHRWRGGYGP